MPSQRLAPKNEENPCIMIHFITPEFPVQHQGAERLELAVHAAHQVRRAFACPGDVGWVRLLIVGAALLSIAYGVMDSADEGDLLALWLMLCAALLAALGVLAPAVGRAGAAFKGSVQAWRLRQAQGHARRQLWADAQQDARLMAELQLIVLHEQALAAASPAEPARLGQGEPAVKLTAFMVQAYTRDAYI